ncbi:hypothetical protein F0562_035620 [Nyssa sinensis]|uniref:Beta-glucosidase n=1 Tax=Nyssa sinensis TaxID=561372 RepID=A0A5J5AD36_9ASTE|nr:hypothetical protein F0562_035620 [Nyssa sinensis]
MGIQLHIFIGLLAIASAFTGIEALTPTYGIASLNRTSFPKGFVFAAATSAYQACHCFRPCNVEGAANEGGKGPSIWDTYTHTYPDKIQDRSNGDVAVDSYYRYKEDVSIMKEMGLDAYRFSISWSRVLPRGKISGGVNEEGIKYYNNLIDELLANGCMEPFVTLFHWDLPQALEDEYGGFLSPRIVNDFRNYAELCFKRFGDRVKHWITLNEPYSYSWGGYATGVLAPGRCSAWQQRNCTGGDSAIEPYLVTHHQLLAHSITVKLYKEKYQASQNGKIGITLVTRWFVPFSDARHHRNAALRAFDFVFGWFMDPLTMGDYPRSMRSFVGNRLPKFSKEQSNMLKGSFDFLGLNYYTANYASYAPNSNSVNVSYLTDSQTSLTAVRNGVPIGEQAGSSWLYVYPRGIRNLLLHIKRKYNNPLIYITENGVDEVNNSTLSLKDALVDNWRIDYHYRHLSFIRQAIKEGANVTGYFAWSLLDNFEWFAGYTVRFGFNYVDFEDGLKRYPKLSAKWFKNFLQK